MPDKPRPYLTAALLCDRVLLEQNGNVSIIRVVDQIQMKLPPEGLPEGTKPLIETNCFVAIKSGPVTGDHAVSLTLISPTGKDKGSSGKQPVTLLGKDQGQNFIFPFVIGVDEEGLYWVIVNFDDLELTRIPLIVRRLEQGEQAKMKTQ